MHFSFDDLRMLAKLGVLERLFKAEGEVLPANLKERDAETR